MHARFPQTAEYMQSNPPVPHHDSITNYTHQATACQNHTTADCGWAVTLGPCELWLESCALQCHAWRYGQKEPAASMACRLSGAAHGGVLGQLVSKAKAGGSKPAWHKQLHIQAQPAAEGRGQAPRQTASAGGHPQVESHGGAAGGAAGVEQTSCSQGGRRHSKSRHSRGRGQAGTYYPTQQQQLVSSTLSIMAQVHVCTGLQQSTAQQ
jgi:hypothetical protein